MAVPARKEPELAVEATETTFEDEVIGSEGKVIVDFWAEWCGPCHAVAPVLDRIADEHDIKLVKVNVDQEQGLERALALPALEHRELERVRIGLLGQRVEHASSLRRGNDRTP